MANGTFSFNSSARTFLCFVRWPMVLFHLIQVPGLLIESWDTRKLLSEIPILYNSVLNQKLLFNLLLL